MTARRIRSLTFEPGGDAVPGRRIRSAGFERRSCLPLSAACLAANGVRETLATLLNAPADLRLIEPLIPEPDAWKALTANALLYCIRGSSCDAAFVLRPGDALALAAAAFGETSAGCRPPSNIEREILERMLGALAGSLASVCGRYEGRIERILDITGFVTYFEAIVEVPAAVRIGIALSREPVSPVVAELRLEDLATVEVEVRAEFARGCLAAADLLDLRPGALVPMMTRMGEPGLLKMGAAALARGECGAIGERNVLIVTAPA